MGGVYLAYRIAIAKSITVWKILKPVFLNKMNNPFLFFLFILNGN
jgi:hypothetical protein